MLELNAPALMLGMGFHPLQGEPERVEAFLSTRGPQRLGKQGHRQDLYCRLQLRFGKSFGTWVRHWHAGEWSSAMLGGKASPLIPRLALGGGSWGSVPALAASSHHKPLPSLTPGTPSVLCRNIRRP